MSEALLSKSEILRLKALAKINILDSLIEEKYDHVTQLASYICSTKCSGISLVDQHKQWFKSRVGIPYKELPRELSFCSHAIAKPDKIMQVENATLDRRFKDNPYVNNLENPIVFYAGIPIKDRNGYVLGTLCVMDDKAGSLDKHQKRALKKLALLVQDLFELHVTNEDLLQSKNQLKKHNDLLRGFAGTVSHDMKMPLANLILTSDILTKKYDDLLDKDGKKYLKYLKTASLSLSDYITNILNHYKCLSYDIDDRESFDLNELLEHIIELINIKHNCSINLPEKNYHLHCNRVALEQIFLNLIGNSIKYNDKVETLIDFRFCEKKDRYRFSITDNGRGIPEDKLHHIFDLFHTVGEYDREGKKGHGIGLSTVKQLVVNMGGSIKATSVVGEQTTFKFTISK